MKKILLLSALLLLTHTLVAQEEVKNVLFIGNSYTEVNNLPEMVQRIAENCGRRMVCQSNTPGGCTFQQHCTNQSMTLIQQGNWDVVVLQEQSQLPSFPQNQVEQECFPYAEQLINSVYTYNPDGEAMLYMTWGRENGDQQNALYFPVLGTYEGMDSMLYERYMYMARTYDASVCPVGRVWRYLRTHNHDIQLYASDGSHPSLSGTYAAACAFYTMIYHESPLLISYCPEIDERQAQIIREAVQTVVFDTLSFWLRQQADTTLPDTTHTDTTHTDTIHTDTTHTDTITLAVPFSTFSQTHIQVYPNPTGSYTTIHIPYPAKDIIIDLYNTKGCLLRRQHSDSTDIIMQLGGLPAGVYMLSIHSDKETHTIPLVIH